MATSTFNSRIKHKRDTSANWTTNNPVLLNGEIILVDTASGDLRFKVGDGTSTYTQLPFTDEPLRSLISDVSDDIPTTTSDLTNDSGFITDAGVTSFNGSTGAITYTAPEEIAIIDMYDDNVYNLVDTAYSNGKVVYLTDGWGIYPMQTADYRGNYKFAKIYAEVTTDNVGNYIDSYAQIYGYKLTSADGLHEEYIRLVPYEELPTQTSDLTNDSNFITLSDVPSPGTTVTLNSWTA